MMNKHAKLAALSSLLAALFSLPAQAGLYQYSFNDSGPIPQGGPVFSVEQTISGIEPVISSVELILTFNDKVSLTGDITGIQGLLDLGTESDSPFVSFQPVVTSTTSQGNRIYDVTFSGVPGSPGIGFDGLDPNSTWALVLWDNETSGLENGLVRWSLDITSVPEPVTTALICFGVLVAGIKLIRRLRRLPGTVAA